jgi:hypothetical protein
MGHRRADERGGSARRVARSPPRAAGGAQPVRRLLFVVVTGLGGKLVYDAERAWVPRHGSATPDR